MNEQAIIGIAILFGISFVVRIVPTFVPLNFSDATQQRIKSHLPVAVFVNLLLYCVYQELIHDFYPAIIALVVLFVLFKPLGLLSSIAVGTVLYISLSQFL